MVALTMSEGDSRNGERSQRGWLYSGIIGVIGGKEWIPSPRLCGEGLLRNDLATEAWHWFWSLSFLIIPFPINPETCQKSAERIVFQA